MADKSIKLSVLVPIYNVSNYIRDCAESLFNQNYPSTEYIFVNDCTPDDSIEILQECIDSYPYLKENIRIIHHNQNKGIGATRKTLFEAAQGEYISYVDSDDMLCSNSLKAMMDIIEKEQADIVEGAIQEIKSKQNYLHTPNHSPKEIFIPLALSMKLPIRSIWAKIFRKDFLTKHNIQLTEGINYAEDLTLLFRAYLKAKRVYTDQCVYIYKHDNTTSYTNNVSEQSVIAGAKAYEQVRAYFEENDKAKKYQIAVDLGILNTMRDCHKRKMDITKVIDPYLNFKPANIITSFIGKLYHYGNPLGLADLFFSIYRKVYLFNVKRI